MTEQPNPEGVDTGVPKASPMNEPGAWGAPKTRPKSLVDWVGQDRRDVRLLPTDTLEDTMTEPKPCLPGCRCTCGDRLDTHDAFTGAEFEAESHAPACPNAKAEAPPACFCGGRAVLGPLPQDGGDVEVQFVHATGCPKDGGPAEAPPSPKRVTMAEARETLMGQLARTDANLRAEMEAELATPAPVSEPRPRIICIVVTYAGKSPYCLTHKQDTPCPKECLPTCGTYEHVVDGEHASGCPNLPEPSQPVSEPPIDWDAARDWAVRMAADPSNNHARAYLALKAQNADLQKDLVMMTQARDIIHADREECRAELDNLKAQNATQAQELERLEGIILLCGLPGWEGRLLVARKAIIAARAAREGAK